MSPRIIYIHYDEEWKENEGSYEWFANNRDIIPMFLQDSSIKFDEFMKKLYERVGVDKNDTELKLSYLPYSRTKKVLPVTLQDDECLTCFLFEAGKPNHMSLIYVEVLKNNRCDMGVYIEENVCDAASAPGWDGANIRCDIVGTPMLDTTASAPTPQKSPLALLSPEQTQSPHCPLSPLAVQSPRFPQSPLSPHCPQSPQSPQCSKLQMVVVENHEALDCVLPDPSEEMFSFTDLSDLAIGQEFENKEEVKNKLQEISLKACFEMTIKKSTKSLYATRCIDSTCKWAVRAARIKNSERFSIRTYCNTHTCSLINRKRKNRQASAAMVAEMVKSHFEGQKKTPTPKAIMTMMQNRNVPISYWKAWKGKQLAHNLLRGPPELSFQCLPHYLYMVRKMNLGTVTHIEVDESDKFKYVFLAYGACIRGFRCMRKVIAVDGTFLKGKFRGTLLLATAQDGNFQQYPLAWAVVNSENDSSWFWFFTKLQELIPDEEDLVIISDRHHSIMNAVKKVYQKSQHGNCRWHLSQNIKNKVKAEGVVQLFEAAANAYKVSDFNNHYNELRNRYPGATKYLEEYTDVKKWARAHFPGSRYNIMTTNGAESINWVLKDAREYPIISLFDFIQRKTSEWFNRRRMLATSIETPETPLTVKAEEIVRERFIKASGMNVFQLNRFEYEVIGKDNNGVVDFGQKSCSCRVFDIDRLPCVHALAACEQAQIQVYDLCSDYYKLSTWTLAYAETIYPVPSQVDWDTPDDEVMTKVVPPDVPKKRGRATTQRIPSIGEGRRRRKRRRRCELCGDLGHTKKKCPLRATTSGTS